VKTEDRVDIFTFGVGHGDCLLVEFVRKGCVSFRLLYDGGASLPAALMTHLKVSRRQDAAPDLDIVVLSHVDSDHQGGFHELLDDCSISIGELWFPCLPAFERLSWLFADRVATAIRKAKELEDVAIERKIDVIYPMENHVQRFVEGAAVTVSVISPASRLLKHLYSGADSVVGETLSRTPLPLEWLVRGEGTEDEEHQDDMATSPFNGATALSRRLLPPGSQPGSLTRHGLREKAASAAKFESVDFEPDFFGNSVLNDTSLVVVVDAVLDGIHRRRIVLSGDQENWSYISSRHPMGLGPDVLKVPHHGGRVYLADVNRIKKGDLPSSGVGQFFIWMRPRIAIVSAKGIHSLPRVEFREAVRSIGTTLVCPNRRGREFIFSGTEVTDAKSCFDQFQCGALPQHEFLRLSLSSQLEDLNAAACLQGNCHRGAAPVVVMQQRLIEPDESFVRWTSAEVRKQAHWLEGFLRRERVSVLNSTQESVVEKFHLPSITWARISAEAKADGLVQFAYNPEPVLRYAVAHGLIWAEDELHRGRQYDLVAALSEKEYKTLLFTLRKCQGLLISIDRLDIRAVERQDWFELLRGAKLEPLMRLCAAWSGLPRQIFSREVWPRLIREIQLSYSGRIVSLENPFHVSLRGDLPAMLHLYTTHTNVQDYFDEDWLESGKGYSAQIKENTLAFAFNDAARMVFPPYATSKYDEEMSLDLTSLHPFVKNNIEYGDYGTIIKVPSGVFPESFAKACWKQLWSH
jgi:hypothetical protein